MSDKIVNLDAFRARSKDSDGATMDYLPEYTVSASHATASIQFKIEALSLLALHDVGPQNVRGFDVLRLISMMRELFTGFHAPFDQLNNMQVRENKSEDRRVSVRAYFSPLNRLDPDAPDESVVGNNSLEVIVGFGKYPEGTTEDDLKQGVYVDKSKFNVQHRPVNSIHPVQVLKLIDNLNEILVANDGFGKLVDGDYLGYLRYSNSSFVYVAITGDLPLELNA